MKWGLAAAVVLALTSWVGAIELGGGYTLEMIAAGFFRPVALVSAGDQTGRLFVVEQDGRIMIIDQGVVLDQPFLDISSQVESGGNEQGLLGIAFHPHYPSSGFFYINYTHDRPGSGLDVTRISRFKTSAVDSNLADHGSEEILLEFEQDFSNHNGGDLHFGPDGYLYIATGDGGSGGDPNNRAQDLNSFLGKLLRIDVDGGLPYAVPPDNPFVDLHTARPEIWSYGLRNPWRFAFDRETGDLFIGDVGQNSIEEINFQPAESQGGENYGWSCMEGYEAPDFNPCDGRPLTTPILVYDHRLGCSVTGGIRYRGNIPSLRGSYIFGDFCSGRIWRASETGDAWEADEWANTDIRISSFGEDDSGELYVLDLGRGEIYRLFGSTAPLVRRSSGKRVRPGKSHSGLR